jgi:ribosomal protein S18 acetylase RimI-like enzyme
MTEVRKIGPDDWEIFRDIRLRSLADAPDAFGSTLDHEQASTETDWRRRASGSVVVVLDPAPVAVGGLFDKEGVGHVWGMWTDPAHRRRGHARAILDSLVPAVGPVQLHVNVANHGARRTYERYGFVASGVLEPLRPGSDQRIELMILRRSPGE